MKKISPAIKYLIVGTAIIGVFVFMFKQTASAFQPRARGQDRIRMFRGRSNRFGTRLGNKQTMTNLAGNRLQRQSQRRATRLMRRS
jgi:hypothetical protein